MKNIYKILLSVMLLYGSLSARAQSRVINGIVRDNDGPLPGATIIEKGVPNNGVSTSIEGRFAITLRGNNNVLIVRSVGYTSREVNVGGKANVEVTLATDAKGLEDVVIVGYGTQKKITVTGAVSSVTREEIQQTPSASLQNALSGKLPGFSSQQTGGRPGADGAAFYVRGISTFNGTGESVQPLILVDDIQFSYSDFANIDPNEVESVSILKDAATTAVYGVKGANGVILVTTRRGKIGAPRITYRTEYGIQKPTHVPQFLDAATTATLYNEAKLNDAIYAGGPSAAATFTAPWSAADIELFRNGKDPYGHPNINWYNTLFKNSAPISKNNIDVSGGTNDLQYFVSVGYQKQGGMLRNFHSDDEVNSNYDFDRLNFRSNLDIKATKSLSFRFDFSANNTTTTNPLVGGASGGGPETAVLAEVYKYEYLSPYVYPIYNPDGSYGFASPNSPGGAPPTANNIIGRLSTMGYSRQRQYQLNLNLSGVQKLDAITRGLQAKVLVAISNGTSSTRTLNRANFPSFYYNPKVDPASAFYDSSVPASPIYTPRNANIYRTDPYALSYAAGRPERQSNIQASLNYARSVGKNNFSALLLFIQSSQLRANFDGTVEQPDSYKPENFRGATSRVNYNYNNKYLVEFDGSYNGSDKFSASHRYGFFPAASAGWVISEENFMKKHVRFINLFKLRSSYGISGSDNLGGFSSFYAENYTTAAGNSFGETSGTNALSILPGTIGNDRVSWEKERKFDAGVDFALLNGRVTGTVDVFDNKRTDILAKRNTIVAYFGVPDGLLPPENLGIVSNKGYEVELGVNGKVSSNFTYNLKGNFSVAKNKILEFDEVPQIFSYKTRTGRSIGEDMIYQDAGLLNDKDAADPTVAKYVGANAGGIANTSLPGQIKIVDKSGDGVITSDDTGYFGKTDLPTTTYGFNTGLTYKRLSLNVLLQGTMNSGLRVGYVSAAPFVANVTPFTLKRWTPETAATAEYPRLVTGPAITGLQDSRNTYWTISGNYLRIKSLELAYRLPEKWVSKVGLKGIRVYANAYNIYTWSVSYNKTGLDPEVANQTDAAGYSAVYPQQAIINMGLSISLK